MVVRLKGLSMDTKEAIYGYHKGNNSLTHKGCPTLLVLENRFQCFPILQLPTAAVATNQEALSFLNCLKMHVQRLLNHHFNDRFARLPRNGLNSTALSRQASRRIPRRRPRRLQQPKTKLCGETLYYQAPLALNLDDVDPSTRYTEVGVHQHFNETCGICSDPLLPKCLRVHGPRKVVRLKVCGHEFHKGCARKSLHQTDLCPTCGVSQKVVKGQMPSGTMRNSPG